MKIAFVYDRVNKWGGAERVLLALHKIWPEAPLYTAVYHPKTAPWAKKFKVIPSFLNQIPLAKSHHEIFPWLMPLGFESFDFSDYDVVISVTSEAAKGIITKPETLHVCYCLTPTRYLYSGYNDYFKSALKKQLSLPAVVYLRSWDHVAAQRPDHYLTISQNVARRIKKYYQRDARVIYPPIDTGKFKPLTELSLPDTERYFLIVSRLVAYKKIEIAIEAFNRLGWRLKIIGTGNQMKKLKKMAKENIKFLGQLTDEQVISYYQNCQAVIFPQEEDFGLVPIEAQACGRPVIAYRKGGVLETVIEGKTGLFFTGQTPAALIKTVRKFRDFGAAACRRQAEKFSQERFKKEFEQTVKRQWENIQS
jgi:glycosyltransferase involved in cell wall biosynthesis